MMQFTAKGPLRTGAVGLTLTVCVVLTSLQFDRVPMVSAERTYRADFADSTGLRVGDKVMVAGVDVGVIRTMSIVNSNRVRIAFTAVGIDVGRDSRVAIKNHTVLGNRELQVDPAGTTLGATEVIGLDHTTTPYVLTDSLGQLTEQISGLRTDSLNDALDEMSKTMAAVQPGLGDTLDGVTRLSRTIGSRNDQLKDLLSASAGLSAILGEQSSQINGIILNGNSLASALLERRRAIDDLIDNIRQVATQLSAFVNNNREQIEPALDGLNQAVALLNRHRDDINHSIKPLQQYAQALGESVASGPFFKAFVTNLLPGQFIQPFIDAALGDYRTRNPLPALPRYQQGPGSPWETTGGTSASQSSSTAQPPTAPPMPTAAGR